MEQLEKWYGLIVFIHVACATIFTMTLIIMQYAVSPALARIPASAEKEQAAIFMHSRWHPVIDTAIALLGITGILVATLRWHMIGVTPLLHWKTTFGIIALVCAGLLHFYYRGAKRRLKLAGKTERLKDVNRLTGIMEKVALYFAVAAWLCGISYNHFPF